MATQIQLRRGTAAQWTAANPTLAQGELGVETDTGKFKLGNGSTVWNSLSYSSGATGATGATGSVGSTGATGSVGSTGATGSAATVTAGTTTTGAAGSNAAVTNSGTSGAAILDFTVPRGNTGVTGSQGIQGVTGAAGADGRTVLNGSGAPSNGTGVNGDFYVNTAANTLYGPKASGAWGTAVSLVGPTGATGSQGATGSAASIAAGTTTTGAAGSSASVTNSGSSSAAVFDFTVPRGNTGVTGATGATGAQGIQGIQGVQGNTGATGTSFTFVGTWSNTTAYLTNDVVYRNGSTYIGVIGNTGHDPETDTANTWWAELAVAGAVGATGSQGVQGVQGATGSTGATGSVGATGSQGIQGATGSTGAAGAAATVAVGSTSTGTAAVTNSGTSSAAVFNFTVPQGVTGNTGATGSTGAAGADGKTVRNGSGTPSAGLGVDGDFYVNTAANTIYGPKASGAWGSSVSLVGPTGSTGATGSAGATGNTGAQGSTGSTGAAGAAATVTVGTTTSGTAAVTNSGTSSAAVLNFTVPTGATGPAGATGATGASGAATLVSTLPASPVDGQEVYYQSSGMATDGTVFHLRYRTAGGTYKWEAVGSTPIRSENVGGRNTSTYNYTTSVTFVAGSALSGTTVVGGPTITVPLAGEYLVTGFAQVATTINSASANLLLWKTGDGAPAAATADSIGFAEQASLSAQRVLTCAASDSVELRYASSSTGSQARFWNRGIYVTPLRVS